MEKSPRSPPGWASDTGEGGIRPFMSEDQQQREADADRAAEAEKAAADPNRKADTTKEAAQEPPD